LVLGYWGLYPASDQLPQEHAPSSASRRAEAIAARTISLAKFTKVYQFNLVLKLFRH
jgi:hypothetical protein